MARKKTNLVQTRTPYVYRTNRWEPIRVMIENAITGRIYVEFADEVCQWVEPSEIKHRLRTIY